jgi:ParB-like chromosome segregation protein Spo0J
MNKPIRSRSLEVEMIDLSSLRPYAKNARRHSRAQIKQIAKSIEAFGFTNPILVSDDLEILAGHGRAAAAQLIGMKQAPIVRLSNLSPAERKAYVLADNKLALNAGWDREILAIELQGLIDLDFDVETTGFALGEIEIILEEAAELRTIPRAEPRMNFSPYAMQRRHIAAMFGEWDVTGLSAATLATKPRTRRFSTMNGPT